MATSDADVKAVESTFKIGTSFTIKGLEITITKVQKKASFGSEGFETTPSEGGVYVIIDYQYKNISKKPINGFWSSPDLKLVNSEDTEFSSDTGATFQYLLITDVDSKAISDLNPGITVKDAEVFEISKDMISQKGWNIKIQDVEIPLTL